MCAVRDVRQQANQTIVAEESGRPQARQTQNGRDRVTPDATPPSELLLDLDLRQFVLLHRQLGLPGREVGLAQQEREDVAGLLLAE
jgi:hypothetical protein